MKINEDVRTSYYFNNKGKEGKLLSAAQKEKNIQSYPAQKTKQGDGITCAEMRKQNKA